MYLRTLHLDNIRCFEAALVNLQYPGRVAAEGQAPVPTHERLRNVNLLLGNNARGKSTILRAAVLALLSPVLRDSGWRLVNYVRRSFTTLDLTTDLQGLIRGEVILSEQDREDIKDGSEGVELRVGIKRVRGTDTLIETTPATGSWEAMLDPRSPAGFVLAYGASRRIAPDRENIAERGKLYHERWQRVASLFDESYSLVPLEKWLPGYDNPGRRVQVINLINELLRNKLAGKNKWAGGAYQFSGEMEGGEYLFRQGDAHVPLSAMSDGYRAFIGWIGDFLYHICHGVQRGEKLREIQGVVLIDEVDSYLHPEWQRVVIETISAAFPRIQFIFTSHSPLVVGSLEWPNLWAMGGSTVTQPGVPIHGLSADQVLTSPYFSLESARPPDVAREIKTLDQQAQSGDPDAVRRFMMRLSRGSESAEYGSAAGLGSTPSAVGTSRLTRAKTKKTAGKVVARAETIKTEAAKNLRTRLKNIKLAAIKKVASDFAKKQSKTRKAPLAARKLKRKK